MNPFMNPAHIQNRIQNRIQNHLRRIHRRLIELESDKARECHYAEEQDREPVLHEILATINRLRRRQRELEA